MRSVMSGLVLSAALICSLPAADVMQADIPSLEAQMRALPALEPTAPRVLTPPAGRALASGVAFLADQRAVVLDGRIEVDQGPIDGLEVLIALAGGKLHEALVALPDDNGELLKGAFTIAMNLPDGRPAPEGSGIPAVGVPVRLQILWQPDPAFEPDRWVAKDASQLVESRVTERAYPPLPYIYTGSHFEVVTIDIPGEDPVQREKFMLSDTRSLVTNYDDGNSLLAAPYPLAGVDLQFQVATTGVPPEGSAVKMLFQPAELLLELGLTDAGELTLAGAVVDDAALATALSEAFSQATAETLRAFAVAVPLDCPAEQLLAIRSRLLEIAVGAGVWAVPVFVPAAD